MATVLCMALLYVIIVLWDINLRDPRYLDGWLLAGFMLAQLTYHVRRGDRGRTFVTAARWMKLHIYTGYLVVALFLVHTQFRLPNSFIEWVLWILFVVTAVSGVVGAYLSATVPVRLDLHRQGMDFDSIPRVRQRLAAEASELAEAAAQSPQLHAVAQFYKSTLYDFLARPRDLLAHIRHSPRPLQIMTQMVDTLESGVTAEAQDAIRKIRQLVATKAYLDFQYAQQLLLQAWLFVHVPATYGLIVASVLHVAHTYAFTTGVP
ncbi:MAG: hypothetical protein ACR2PA_11925 [Hyphomicrobiaceae bacterium]